MWRDTEFALGRAIAARPVPYLVEHAPVEPSQKSLVQDIALSLECPRIASAIFCCSSSFNSLRNETWVGTRPSRSTGVSGVAAPSASDGSVIAHPRGGP